MRWLEAESVRVRVHRLRMFRFDGAVNGRGEGIAQVWERLVMVKVYWKGMLTKSFGSLPLIVWLRAMVL